MNSELEAEFEAGTVSECSGLTSLTSATGGRVSTERTGVSGTKGSSVVGWDSEADVLVGSMVWTDATDEGETSSSFPASIAGEISPSFPLTPFCSSRSLLIVGSVGCTGFTTTDTASRRGGAGLSGCGGEGFSFSGAGSITATGSGLVGGLVGSRGAVKRRIGEELRSDELDSVSKWTEEVERTTPPDAPCGDLTDPGTPTTALTGAFVGILAVGEETWIGRGSGEVDLLEALVSVDVDAVLAGSDDCIFESSARDGEPVCVGERARLNIEREVRNEERGETV